MSRCATTRLLVGLVCAAVYATTPLAAAQSRARRVQSPRLYMFDCGTLKSADAASLTKQGVLTTDMSVTAFLIVHPKGTLLWDTCVIPDSLIKPGGTTEARATAEKTLKGQLAEVGYKPSDITYLALSHYHYDHSANANDYAGSTWLVQKPEHEAMFTEQALRAPNSERYTSLKSSKTVILEGDHDVFGDGTVIIKSTPGHTPGHQSLFITLAKTGPVVLSGDLYHYPEERAGNVTFFRDSNSEQNAASRAALEAFLEKTGAQLWIQHDLVANAKRKRSPAYFE